MVLEVRTYRIRAGERDTFGRRMTAAVPLLERQGIDVVWHGPSDADDDHYMLLRAFDSVDDREVLENAFYGSDAWRQGPREGIVTLIETYHTVVVRSTQAGIQALGESLKFV